MQGKDRWVLSPILFSFPARSRSYAHIMSCAGSSGNARSFECYTGSTTASARDINTKHEKGVRGRMGDPGDDCWRSKLDHAVHMWFTMAIVMGPCALLSAAIPPHFFIQFSTTAGRTAGRMGGTADNGGRCQCQKGGGARSSAESGKQGQWIQNPSESFRQTVGQGGSTAGQCIIAVRGTHETPMRIFWSWMCC
jgi:hypothetical protein